LTRGGAPLLTCIALLLAGCGLGEGERREGGAELRVTRDFGHERVGQVRVGRVPEGQTVMRLLRSRFDVETRFGGRFVQKIDGLAGRGLTGQRDWFYFVNGIEAGVGAAEYELSPGDVVQWDYRRWDRVMRVPAIVGAFPEPFVHGREGKRLPVRVECTNGVERPCEEVRRRLRSLGVKAAGAPLGVSGTTNVARVVVGPWRRAKLVRAAAALERGPDRSGVFARFRDGGRSLVLLDGAGRPARRAAPGAGLIAAASAEEDQLVWIVTGVGERGVAAAARALGPSALRDAYAVAVEDRRPTKLPLVAR
jgi:hypothetical protein